MEIESYAKINLCLWVLGVRNDRYHEIRTVFHPIELKDEIRVERSNLVQIRCEGGPEGYENIAFNVLQTLSHSLKKFIGAKIYIKKGIPVGGGLGGGSSNAASILKALNHIYELDLDPDRILNIARKIGNDVPYFLIGGTASARGKGDILTHIKTSFNGNFYIFYPELEISTPWAYKEFSRKKPKKNRKEKEEIFKKVIKHLRENTILHNISILNNDFQTLVFGVHPFYRSVVEKLLKEGANRVLLSGTGSCLWALFDEKREIKLNSGRGFWTKTLNWGVV